VDPEVVPATAARFDDVATVLAPGGEGACWCQYYRMSASEYGRSSSDQLRGRAARRAALLRARCEAAPSPGMLAFEQGKAVGWCGIGPWSEFVRLGRSRTLPAPYDPATWSVVCFLVRPGFRRRGVASALLEGAVGYARRCGAPAIEGYPVDPGARRIDTASAYVGTTSMFERAGFRRIAETAARSARLARWVMRLEL
jgi:GNAT superfamily N-acetyltransferase